MFLVVLAILPVVWLVGSCGDDNPTDSGKSTRIFALNGLYYKGVMGDTIADSVLMFAVLDKDDKRLLNRQIKLYQLAGDGEISHSSVVTGSTGWAGFWYAFTGDSGHAAVRLVVEGVDSMVILLRADVLIPGPGGQAQYVLFDDTYADVKKFNGPGSVDTYPNESIIYVDYENSLGVVVMVYDIDMDRTIYDSSSVLGVIVNTVYEGTTTDSVPIRVGSPISDIRTVFGEPDIIRYDSAPPGSPPGDSSVYIEDKDQGLTYYCDFTVDTIVFEIHLIEWVPPAAGYVGDDAVSCLSEKSLRRPR
ncbi:MAG: hypothetical protein ABII79_04840 [bacterium]